MMKHLSPAALLLLSACTLFDGKSGLAENSVDRMYAKPVAEVYEAAERSLQALNLTVSDNRHDSLGGVLVAQRVNGNKVRLDIRAVTEKSARVSVHVEEGDIAMANLIHKRIAEELGIDKPEPGRR